MTAPAPSSAQTGSLDRLVADGRAIGVRVVLDLTCGRAPGVSPGLDSAALVDVPAEAFALVDGLPTYGC